MFLVEQGIEKNVYDYQLKHAEPITYDTVSTLIENSKELNDDEKIALKNEKLLNDVIPYYNGTNMDFIATKCFHNIHFKYYNKYKEDNNNEKTKILETVGYYIRTNPNEINIKRDLTPEEEFDTKCHEYIHLLQAKHKYIYIVEACAEIISTEYYDTSLDKYEKAIINTKILLEIVGPEPIWKLNFAGDDTELVSIINENLEPKKLKIC